MKQAMIFAAGLGTRLKPLTDTMPKALVPVGGMPLLRHVITTLQRSGFDRIVVNVHHFAQQIIDYLEANDHFGLDIRISDERRQLLDTGGGLRKASAEQLFDPASPVLIHNVDILSNVDLSHFYSLCAAPGTSQPHGTPTAPGSATAGSALTAPQAQLLVSWRKTQRYLLFDDDMMLVGWVNLATGEVRSPHATVREALARLPYPLAPGDSPLVLADRYHAYAFSGIHCLSPRLLAMMEAWPDKFAIIDFYLQMCHDVPVRGYVKQDLRLMDVGKLDTLGDAEDFVRTLHADASSTDDNNHKHI